MSVLALVPARSGSKGIPGKNERRLGGVSITQRALDVAFDVGAYPVVLSTDLKWILAPIEGGRATVLEPFEVVRRPAALAQDDTPMLAVVQHALEQIPGPDDQIIVLLQPTAVFRTATHIREAIRLLRETPGADSVVSVVELPLTASPDMLGLIKGAWLRAWNEQGWPTRRQEATPAYRRDGTVYAFWRRTVQQWNSIYGINVVPLIIPPEQSCELDTEADWREVERRWSERHAKA